MKMVVAVLVKDGETELEQRLMAFEGDEIEMLYIDFGPPAAQLMYNALEAGVNQKERLRIERERKETDRERAEAEQSLAARRLAGDG